MCAAKSKLEAQNPLILRCHRLMDAFAKSDDERDFYIDRQEGFIIYIDLDKAQEELDSLENELAKHSERYCAIPKLSYYETKKIMEGFVNEKVYDIDTKEKLLDIIQSKEARENFLEFIYDHHSELEKWQQFYQERSRIRIIEWLRQNHFHFVFEEDLEFPPSMMEKLKQSLFQSKVGKDILNARKALIAKAKTYYSNEALNPRPKRGRPPKQIVKTEIEPQVTIDIYNTVPNEVRPFLYSPDLIASPFSAFSSKFSSEEELIATKRQGLADPNASLSQKLASLRSLSSKWVEDDPLDPQKNSPYAINTTSFDDDEEEDDDDDFNEKSRSKSQSKVQTKKKTEPIDKETKTKTLKKLTPSKPKVKRIMPQDKQNVKRIMPKNDNSKPNRRPLKKIIPKKK